jgi:TRAP-type C4-dicarboxylate transport system permease small subunit
MAHDATDRPPAEAESLDRPPAEAESLGGESNPELLPRREPWRTIVHGIGIGEQVVGALLMLVVLVLVLAQVAQRYVPGSFPWTGEVARLAMVWATFVIAGYLAAFDRHIAIHVVDFVLAGRPLATLKLVANVIVLATSVAMVYATYQLVSGDIGQVTAAAQLPLLYVNAVPIIGFSLVALRAGLGIVLVDVPGVLGRSPEAAA